MDLRSYGIALPVHFHESAYRPAALALFLARDRAFSLIPNEQHVIPSISPRLSGGSWLITRSFAMQETLRLLSMADVEGQNQHNTMVGQGSL